MNDFLIYVCFFIIAFLILFIRVKLRLIEVKRQKEENEKKYYNFLRRKGGCQYENCFK